MGMGNFLALAGAGAGGWAEGTRARKEQEMRQAELDMRKQEHQLRMDEADRQKQDRTAVADAARPAAVEPLVTNDDDGNPSSAPPLRVTAPGLPQAQSYADAGAAQKAADAYNTPDATSARIAQTLMTRGRATDAISLQGAALKQKHEAFAFSEQQREAARKLDEEGILDAARASRTGNAQEVFNLYNKRGTTKLAEVPQVKAVEMRVPGINHPVTAYEYTGTMVLPDGTTQPWSANSHDMSMKTFPYEKMLKSMQEGSKEQREAKESEAKSGYYDALAGKNNALAATGGTTPKRADHFEEKEWDKAAGIDKTIVSIPGGPMGDKDVESADLRAAHMRVFNNARRDGTMSPMEAKEYAATTIVRLKNAAADRVTQAQAAGQKLTLQESLRQIIKEADKASAAAGQDGGSKIPAATQAARDSDRVVMLNEELTRARARLAAGDQRAQGDVDALERELRAAGSTAARVGAGAAPNPAAAPVVAAAPARVAAQVGIPAQPAPAPSLDVARQAAAGATARLNAYGLRQRQQDPQGFARAQAEAQAAGVALEAAQQRAATESRRSFTSNTGPAFVAAQP